MLEASRIMLSSLSTLNDMYRAAMGRFKDDSSADEVSPAAAARSCASRNAVPAFSLPSRKAEYLSISSAMDQSDDRGADRTVHSALGRCLCSGGFLSRRLAQLFVRSSKSA